VNTQHSSALVVPPEHSSVSPRKSGSPDNSHPSQHLQDLIERLEELPDAARELSHECIHSVLELYGRGLARVLQLAQNATQSGQPILDGLLRDQLISSLLLVHGLHPVDLETRLRGALEKVRPYMQSHGGSIELVSLVDGVARLRFNGNCKSCPSSTVTMELAIRGAIEEKCPDLAGLELDGAVPAPQNLPLKDEPNGHGWLILPNGGDLQPGEMKRTDLAGMPLIVCNLGGNLYAYRDCCPVCGLPLECFALAESQLRCRLGHRYDVRHAGRSLEKPHLHLDPFPLLVENGVVKMAVK